VRDQRAEALARVLVRYSSAVTAGDRCAIHAGTAAEPLALLVYEEVLRAGGLPVVHLTMDGQAPAYFKLASDEQLDWVSAPERWVSEEADVQIAVMAEANTRALSGVDPARQARRKQATFPLQKRIMERSAAGEFRWSLTLFPTHAYAAEADMSLADYEDFFYKACLCDRDDPVTAWIEQSERVRRLAEWMSGKEEVHIEAPGTDLRLAVGGRRFIAAEGRHNMPDGEFFTGPVEDSASGQVTFSYPAIFGGREVSGVKLRFDNGEVVDASAERNEAFLHEMLDTDAGSRRLGELGIGANYGIDRFTKEILLDEKIGGTVHLAVGSSYPETGGRNESALHWDMVCDLRAGGRITVDGEPLQVGGRFVV
jgi:aminopeptidase